MCMSWLLLILIVSMHGSTMKLMTYVHVTPKLRMSDPVWIPEVLRG